MILRQDRSGLFLVQHIHIFNLGCHIRTIRTIITIITISAQLCW